LLNGRASELSLESLFTTSVAKKIKVETANRKTTRAWAASLSRKDGTKVLVEVSTSYFQRNGERFILVMVNENPTGENGESEEKEREKLFSTALQTSPVARSIIAKSNYEIVEVNAACCQFVWV
jgi:PAS domain-containing protein